MSRLAKKAGEALLGIGVFELVKKLVGLAVLVALLIGALFYVVPHLGLNLFHTKQKQDQAIVVFNGLTTKQFQVVSASGTGNAIETITTDRQLGSWDLPFTHAEYKYDALFNLWAFTDISDVTRQDVIVSPSGAVTLYVHHMPTITAEFLPDKSRLLVDDSDWFAHHVFDATTQLVDQAKNDELKAANAAGGSAGQATATGTLDGEMVPAMVMAEQDFKDDFVQLLNLLNVHHTTVTVVWPDGSQS